MSFEFRLARGMFKAEGLRHRLHGAQHAIEPFEKFSRIQPEYLAGLAFQIEDLGCNLRRPGFRVFMHPKNPTQSGSKYGAWGLARCRMNELGPKKKTRKLSRARPTF